MSSVPIIVTVSARIERVVRILYRLRQTIDRLGSFPELGRPRPEFNLPGLRSLAVNPHVIFYSISNTPSVIIHQVADGRGNLAVLFPP